MLRLCSVLLATVRWYSGSTLAVLQNNVVQMDHLELHMAQYLTLITYNLWATFRNNNFHKDNENKRMIYEAWAWPTIAKDTFRAFTAFARLYVTPINHAK